MHNYKQFEREVAINFNDEEKTANICTLSFPMRRKLLKLAEERPDEVTIKRQTDDVLIAIVPKKWVKIRPSIKLSEDERRRRADMLKNTNKLPHESTLESLGEGEDDKYDTDE